jgi:hypothetical protein
MLCDTFVRIRLETWRKRNYSKCVRLRQGKGQHINLSEWVREACDEKFRREMAERLGSKR